MFDFCRRNTRRLAMSSTLLLATLLGAACDPSAAQSDAGAVIASPAPEEILESAPVLQPGPLASSALQASPSSNRADAHELEGSTLQGSVAIHLALKADANVEKVEFYLDDPARKGAPVTTLTQAPFDLAGTVSASEAALFNTQPLSNGEHTVTAAVTFRGQPAQVVSARFQVDNGQASAQTPDASPSPGTAVESEGPVTATASASVTGLRTVAGWETLFLKRWNSDHTGDFLPRSTSNDSWQFYNLGYGIDGNTAMYRATGKTQYLDRALLYVNNMVNSARASSTMKSNFRDSYLGWTSKRSATLNQEAALYESYCWRYVTGLLRIIRETPALYGNATYRAQYDKLLAFTEKNIFEKWYTRGANTHIYRVNTHMAAHWAKIALDLSRITTDATRKARYLTVLNNINRDLPNYTSSLRQQMKPSPVNSAAYFWSATWGSTSRPGQDVSHGNGVMAYIVEAHDAGVEWTDADMTAFVNTLNKVIWPTAGKYGNYVDGSGTGNGWFNDGLMKLGRYSPALQKRLETHSVGNNTQYYGNGALNVKLLPLAP
jgi:hypothetical protein